MTLRHTSIVPWIRRSRGNAVVVRDLSPGVRGRLHWRRREISLSRTLVAAWGRLLRWCMVAVDAVRRASVAAGRPRICESRVSRVGIVRWRRRHRGRHVSERLEDAGKPRGCRTHLGPVLVLAWEGWVARRALLLVALRWWV